MATDLRSRPVVPSASWVGDPLILVYAVRHAVTLPPTSHVRRFVQQSVTANVHGLSLAGRRVIGRDIAVWLDTHPDATAEERAEWISILADLGVE